ncbi:hypothetical protein Tco_1167660 [Tanacetum coccineum]
MLDDDDDDRKFGEGVVISCFCVRLSPITYSLRYSVLLGAYGCILVSTASDVFVFSDMSLALTSSKISFVKVSQSQLSGNGYPRKGQKSKRKRQNRARERKERKEKSSQSQKSTKSQSQIKSKSTPGSGFGKRIENRTRKPKLPKVDPVIPT